jgi:hypothetical protein
VSAQNLADHRRFGVTARRDDENIAGADPIDGKENRAEVGRLAQGRNSAPKQARLPPGWQQRSDRRINLILGAPHIDRNGDRNIPPAFDLSIGQIARGDRVDSNGQGFIPSCSGRPAGGADKRDLRCVCVATTVQ